MFECMQACVPDLCVPDTLWLCVCVCVQKSVCERESIFSGVIETGAGQVLLVSESA